jgi:putative transposase
MLKPNELIRTEKHPLQAGGNAHADLLLTVGEYRKLVRALAGIIFVNLSELTKASSRCFAVERLFHATADHPSPRYVLIDRMFLKFPSYLRRAAIKAAYGAVSSFVSNYARWQAGIRSKRAARPPSFARALEVNPPLYGGQCIKPATDWSSVTIKVLRKDATWGWSEPMAVRGRFKRSPGDERLEALSPTLLVTERRASLACPVKTKKH